MFPETRELPFQFPRKINFSVVTAPLYKRISWFPYVASTMRLILKGIPFAEMDSFKHIICKCRKVEESVVNTGCLRLFFKSGIAADVMLYTCICHVNWQVYNQFFFSLSYDIFFNLSACPAFLHLSQ